MKSQSTMMAAAALLLVGSVSAFVVKPTIKPTTPLVAMTQRTQAKSALQM